jgi:hypothetical protein
MTSGKCTMDVANVQWMAYIIMVTNSLALNLTLLTNGDMLLSLNTASVKSAHAMSTWLFHILIS